MWPVTADLAGERIEQSTRQRIIAAAAQLTTASGWSSVTMSRLADEVGVSRQTVYNEIGSKPALAEALVLTELGRFLSAVEAAFDSHPDDLVDAIRQAAHDVLVLAAHNELLRAVVSATHGADTELLPLLTTHSESLLTVAKQVVTERVMPYEVPFNRDQTEAAIDVVVRVVLSHVMQPSGTPAHSADAIAWVAERALRD
ncbi:TetR/AcrR family transcriptional regulator [Luteipulveratus mongoliensis]